MNIQMLWEVTPRRLLYGYSFWVHDSEDEDTVVLRNGCSHLTVELV
jgi:hypothetical protein